MKVKRSVPRVDRWEEEGKMIVTIYCFLLFVCLTSSLSETGNVTLFLVIYSQSRLQICCHSCGEQDRICRKRGPCLWKLGLLFPSWKKTTSLSLCHHIPSPYLRNGAIVFSNARKFSFLLSLDSSSTLTGVQPKG